MEYVKLPKKYKTTRIKNINFDYNIPTYDIEVKDSHYYKTKDGIISHNTLNLMHPYMAMSYGIEPSFGLYFWKRTRISGKYEYYFCVPRAIRNIFEENNIKLKINSDTVKDTWDGKIGKSVAKIIDENIEKLNIKFKSSIDINALDKLDLISKVQQNIDNSISTTFMLSENSTVDDVYNFILEGYKKEVKSIAAFPDKKMYGIISFIPFKDLALKLKSEGIDIHPQNFDEEELKDMKMSNDYIVATSAPKRPLILPADIYSVIVKGEKFLVALGLLNGAPYEIFCGKMNGLNFKFQHKKGIIEKVKRGQYKLEIGNDIVVEDFSGYFKPVEAELFRLVSAGLRHGIPLKFLYEQLSKSSTDISSLTAAAARVLGKYIKKGEIANGIECPNCHKSNTIEYTDGCQSCSSCNWSKCS